MIMKHERAQFNTWLRPFCITPPRHYLISGAPPFLASSLLSMSGDRVMLEGIYPSSAINSMNWHVTRSFERTTKFHLVAHSLHSACWNSDRPDVVTRPASEGIPELLASQLKHDVNTSTAAQLTWHEKLGPDEMCRFDYDHRICVILDQKQSNISNKQVIRTLLISPKTSIYVSLTAHSTISWAMQLTQRSQPERHAASTSFQLYTASPPITQISPTPEIIPPPSQQPG